MDCKGLRKKETDMKASGGLSGKVLVDMYYCDQVVHRFPLCVADDVDAESELFKHARIAMPSSTIKKLVYRDEEGDECTITTETLVDCLSFVVHEGDTRRLPVWIVLEPSVPCRNEQLACTNDGVATDQKQQRGENEAQQEEGSWSENHIARRETAPASVPEQTSSLQVRFVDRDGRTLNVTGALLVGTSPQSRETAFAELCASAQKVVDGQTLMKLVYRDDDGDDCTLTLDTLDDAMSFVPDDGVLEVCIIAEAAPVTMCSLSKNGLNLSVVEEVLARLRCHENKSVRLAVETVMDQVKLERH